MNESKPAELRTVAFRKEREGHWLELERLVNQAIHRGMKSLSERELHQLPILYRAALSSLSVARSTALDRALTTYLEALASRAYLVVYASRRPTHNPLATFLFETFPARTRALRHELFIATAVFLLGLVVSVVLVRQDPLWFYAFVDEGMASGRTPAASTDALRETLYASSDTADLSVFASFLFTHNARIGMLAFALGFAAGIPTLILLFINGLTLGGFIALFWERGLLLELLGWLLPHGVPELTAMILCGAAGLALGRAVVLPGQQSIRQALMLNGRHAAIVVAGSVVLFAIAGVFEGIGRQVITDDAPRAFLILFNLVWLGGWLAFGGRQQDGAS